MATTSCSSSFSCPADLSEHPPSPSLTQVRNCGVIVLFPSLPSPFSHSTHGWSLMQCDNTALLFPGPPLDGCPLWLQHNSPVPLSSPCHTALGVSPLHHKHPPLLPPTSDCQWLLEHPYRKPVNKAASAPFTLLLSQTRGSRRPAGPGCDPVPFSHALPRLTFLPSSLHQLLLTHEAPAPHASS